MLAIGIDRFRSTGMVSQGRRTVKYEEMLPHEIAAARASRPVAWLPIGTLEWHGVHNAVGLDALKARAICVKAAEEYGGLCMPALWWGEHREIQLVDVNDTIGVRKNEKVKTG